MTSDHSAIKKNYFLRFTILLYFNNQILRQAPKTLGIGNMKNQVTIITFYKLVGALGMGRSKLCLGGIEGDIGHLTHIDLQEIILVKRILQYACLLQKSS